MKRRMILLFILLVVAAAAVFFLAAPQTVTPEPFSPQIRPAELTAESAELLALLGSSLDQDIRLIDFTAPADARRLVITQWALEDGQWVVREDDMISLNGSDSGRIVLSYVTLIEGAGVAISMDGAIYSCDHEGMYEATSTALERLTAYLTIPADIVLEEEIPLLYQIHGTDSGVSAIPLELWQEADRFAQYSNVALVTVRFSAEPLGEETPQP